jgi:4-hydroxy-tetrahydrodipicolinate synthase
VKVAASLLGRSRDLCRLPMAPVADSTRARVRDAIAGAGLLN